MGQGGISRTAISDRFHICGRLRGRKRNLQVCMARSEVLTSVRPLMRPIICRGPVWEFADWIQITGTRSRRSVKNWLADPVSHRPCAILSFRPPYASDASAVGASHHYGWSPVNPSFSLHGPRDTGHLVRQRHDDEQDGPY